MVAEITSISNEKIKRARKLASSGAYRKETGLFFLEGQRLCTDAARSGMAIESFFYTAEAAKKNEDAVHLLSEKAESAYLVSEAVCSRLGETQSPQGLFCVCKIPDRKPQILPDQNYVVLERIQDPANLGAICRTAEALGICGAVLFGCCDVWNPKAQRAAMGSLLRLELFLPNELTEFLKDCKKSGMRLLATTPRSDAENITALSLHGGVLAVIGNEANGVSPQTAALCESVTIPMAGRAESLNASMAAAIVMWEMMRGTARFGEAKA